MDLLKKDNRERLIVFFLIGSIAVIFSGRAVQGIFLILALGFALSVYNRDTFTLLVDWVKKSRWLWIVGLAFACLGLSYFSSLNPSVTLSTWGRLLFIPFIIFAIFLSVRKKTDWMKWTIMIFPMVLSIIGIFSFWFYPPLYGYFRGNANLSFGDLFDVYTALKPIANAYILVLPILFYVIVSNVGKLRFLAILSALAISGLVYVVHAKAAMAGILIIIFLMTISFLLRYFSFKNFLFFCFGIGLSIFAISQWLDQLTYGFSENNAHLVSLPVWMIDFHRQVIWGYALDKIFENPIWGYGVNASNYLADSTLLLREYFDETYVPPDGIVIQVYPGHPHNWLLEILLEAGLVGFIPFLLMVGTIFYVNLKNYLRTGHLALLAAIGVNAGYWGSGLFNFSYWSAWWQAGYYVCIFTCLILYWYDERSPKMEVEINEEKDSSLRGV